MSNQAKNFTSDEVPGRYHGILPRISLTFETYGRLNAAGDNAILVVHGFSSNSHVASHHAGDTAGWWEWAVGPGRPLDTDRYFIVCANNLGSCFGSSGPASPAAADGQPLGGRFPAPALADIVAGQRLLQEGLGIGCWYAVIGGSLGGMAALEWAAAHPGRVRRAICLNAGAMVSCIGRGLLGLQAQMIGLAGLEGLRLARRLATLSFVGEEFFRHEQRRDPAWRLEEFLAAEAEGFAARFNLHSYTGFLAAMLAFDLRPPAADGVTGDQPEVFLVGCAEDILFPPPVIAETAERFAGRAVVHTTVVSSMFGHDAFLMDEGLYAPLIGEMISHTEKG